MKTKGRRRKMAICVYCHEDIEFRTVNGQVVPIHHCKGISPPPPVYEKEVCETCRHKDPHNEERSCHRECGPFGKVCVEVEGVGRKLQCPQEHLQAQAAGTLLSGGLSFLTLF